MTVPASFLKDGFVSGPTLRKSKFRRLMVGLDGPPDSGKTEFMLSAPGPGILLCLDRGIDGVLDNPKPPESRSADFAFKVIQCPKATQYNQKEYQDYWNAFYKEWRAGLENPDARVVCLDGDSDSWELQRLAEFGRLAKVPSTLYDNVNAARRAMYARAYDSGKIIITSNRIRKTYVVDIDPVTHKPKTNSSGNEVRIWNGEYERQGFNDQDYLWSIQLRCYYNEEKACWGVRIMKCKVDRTLVGLELEGTDCNFSTLVETCYPQVPLSEWGF